MIGSLILHLFACGIPKFILACCYYQVPTYVEDTTSGPTLCEQYLSAGRMRRGSFVCIDDSGEVHTYEYLRTYFPCRISCVFSIRTRLLGLVWFALFVWSLIASWLAIRLAIKILFYLCVDAYVMFYVFGKQVDGHNLPLKKNQHFIITHILKSKQRLCGHLLDDNAEKRALRLKLLTQVWQYLIINVIIIVYFHNYVILRYQLAVITGFN